MSGTRKWRTPASHVNHGAIPHAIMGCGVPIQNVKLFVPTPGPELLNYLDLCPGPYNGGGKVVPDGVAESRDRPLLYFIRNDKLSADHKWDDQELRRLRRALGSRGERAFLAIVEPGLVRVIPVSLDTRSQNWEEFQPNTPNARSLFARMALGEYDPKGTPNADFVYQAMFKLLTEVANRVGAASPRIERRDILSLVGRALFLRFLSDRGVVTAQNLQEIAPGARRLDDCFLDATKTVHTCQWLDNTFNGDFLPLSGKGNLAWFRQLALPDNEVFKHLRAILRDEEPAGGGYQQQLRMDWSTFDFAHVPVGLLSQVYEGFVWQWEPEEAEDTSVHYTPRRIAEYLVDDAFDGMRRGGKAHVLDPACGAGVFLVLAFRRLYQERWKAMGQRPDRRIIRDILNKQLRGFDISESALRLAALSLYLTAVELDPKPTPPHALRFKNLRGAVLFNCRRKEDPEKGPVVGSLDLQMLEGHRGRYQMVLCNPPWRSLDESKKAVATTFHAIGREVLNERNLTALAESYENPDSVPDLPFVWRAMQWCEPSGRIAFVLPARLLFKQGDIGQRAREAILQAVTVTGMLNCSNLSDTNVWPEMQQPFLLFFARNRPPKPDHTVRWITVHPDEALNDRGEIRVDSKSIEEVSLEQTFAEPWLWKALALGTALDIEVVRKVKQSDGVPLQRYWEEDLKLLCTNGYSVKKKGQRDASFLEGLPNVTARAHFKFSVRTSVLPLFARTTAARPRSREYYRAPLVLVKESPGIARANGRAWLAQKDVAFNQSFHGFSGAGHPEGRALVRYLQLVTHSDLWMHYALLTSPKLGAERRVIYKEDLEGFPIIPWAKLSHTQRTLAQKLSERLLGEDAQVFADIDGFFADLYDLKPRDMEVIRDTLSVELPFKSVRRRASASPKPQQCTEFCARMETVLRPFFKRIGQGVCVTLSDIGAGAKDAPFSAIVITNTPELSYDLDDTVIASALELASGTGASMAMIDAEIPRTLIVAILNHSRYWTASRARLCAIRILSEGMGPFEE
ncbi:MAG TPA: N-6 DNA methylase [Verrucomicrobiae bacterium]|nr:N-6 DNA methylase [Verrucomicrobiae bacterium]